LNFSTKEFLHTPAAGLTLWLHDVIELATLQLGNPNTTNSTSYHWL